MAGIPTTDFGLLRGAATDILNLSGQSAEQAAAARGQDITSQGDLQEASAYGTAGEIAARNADLEGVAGRIQGLQQQREAMKAIASGRAVAASSGLANGGSVLDIARSSLQQSYLGQQLINTQTAISQGGFLEQGAASDAEIAAAKTAAVASGNLADAQRQASATSAQNAANATDALQQYINANPPQTAKEAAAQGLATSTVTGLDRRTPASIGGDGITDLSDPQGDQTKSVGNFADPAAEKLAGYAQLSPTTHFTVI